MFGTVLEQLQPVCVSEQKFLTSFFHFEKPVVMSDEDETNDALDGMLNDDNDWGMDSVQGMLGQLLGLLLPEIEAFITFGERLDN